MADAIPGWSEIATRIPVASGGTGPRSVTLPLQIGGRDLWLSFVAVRSAHEDVGKNGERGPRADDVLDGLQTIDQLFFGNREFHRGLTIAVLPGKKSILIKGCG